MNANAEARWRRISDIFHGALERDESERAAFLESACAGDGSLLDEVESLLRAGSLTQFVEAAEAAWDRGDRAADAGALAGRQLGSYQLHNLLGAGGMGEVYAAHDPRLKRDVAVKVLPAVFAADRRRLHRFEQEAHAAAALNHPNILAVHDIGIDADIPFIVMERVRGETLAQWLARARPSVTEALAVAEQVADALAAAHARGIVHRDLKPANVMLTPEAHVKVLDFGVAKMLGREEDNFSTTNDFGTRAGQVLGTPAYMAPEQLNGRPVDHRADIYSLGVMLFELTTGRRPFDGPNLIAVGVNTLKQPTPKAADIEPSVPVQVSELIARCMSRDPALRPASMSAVKAELEQLRSAIRYPADAGAGAAATERRVRPSAQRLSRRTVLTAGAVVTAVVVAGWSSWWSRRAVPVAGQTPYVAVMPLTNLSGQSSNDHLGVGVADALTTGLTTLSTISVIPRETTAASARSASEPATLAAELGVDFLVLGSFQRSGDNIRVDARLITRAGAVAWAGSAEALVSNLFDIERQLAERVVEALRIRVSPAERRQLAAQPTRSAAALEEYWRGIALLEKTDIASVDEAIRVFERAIALDDRFSLAHAGRGAAFVRKFTITNDRAWMTKALDAASQALALDPGQIPVRLLVANVHASTGRNATAVEELRAILSDQPTNDEARRRLAVIFESEGRQAEALEQLQAALALRPEYWRNHDDIGLFYYRIRQMDSAIRAFTRVTELRPDSARGYQRLGAAYLDAGDKTAARIALERANSITPDASAYSNLGTIFYSEREYEAAAAAFKAAIQLRPTGAAYHRNLGDAYEKLGRTLDAQQEYEEAARITERAVTVNPNDARTAAQLAVYTAKLRRFADAERYIDRALTLNPASPDVLYRRAVVSALAGDTANAMKELANAVSKGYATEQVRDDDDLASLRGLPEFQSLIAPVQ